MITKVTENDAAEIAAIYNYYIRESVATFDRWNNVSLHCPHLIHILFTEQKMVKLPVFAMPTHGKKKMHTAVHLKPLYMYLQNILDAE